MKRKKCGIQYVKRFVKSNHPKQIDLAVVELCEWLNHRKQLEFVCKVTHPKQIDLEVVESFEWLNHRNN